MASNTNKNKESNGEAYRKGESYFHGKKSVKQSFTDAFYWFSEAIV